MGNSPAAGFTSSFDAGGVTDGSGSGCTEPTVGASADRPLVIQTQTHFRSPAFAEYQARIADQLVRTSELRLYAVEDGFLPVDSSRIDTSNDD